ncbi:MAG TPA: acyltransferase [Dongiaceae bacterium]|nr:acyltransferase [Dongiaceae bacterium]
MTDQKRPGGAISTGHRLLYLDGWRGISILTVYLGHFLPLRFIDNGRMGVELFFVLSGRLMAEILFVERYPLDLFYRRRIARVWPGMVAFVLVMWLVFREPGPLQVHWVDVVSALTLSLNYVCLYLHRMPVLEHVWSLCIEEWAYILLGLLALVSRRLRLAPLPIIAAAAAVCAINGIIQSAMGLDYYMVYWRTDTRIASILMATAVYLVVQRRGQPVPGWLPILAGCLGVVLNLDVFPDAVHYSIGSLCLSLAVATIDQAPAWLRQLLSLGPIRQIGLWSFSLYLWQQPFYKLIHAAPRPLLVAGAVGCGLVSFYGVEQPLRRWLNRRWRARPNPAAGPADTAIGPTTRQEA